MKAGADEGTITVATVNAIAQWYPAAAGGCFVLGGLGVGSMTVEFRVPSVATISDRTTALGYQVGAGDDLRLGSNFSLTSDATFFGTAGGTVQSSNAKFDANVAQIGLGLTWH